MKIMIKITLPILFGLITLMVVSFARTAVAEPEMVSSTFVTEYPIPTSTNGEPRNIVIEAPGRVWFTLPAANAVGSLVVTSTIDYQFELFDVPTADSVPYDLVYDGSAIWFTEFAGNKIGRLDLTTRMITETAPISTTNSGPTGITISPNGTIWVTERDGNNLLKFDPVTQTFNEYPYSKTGALLEDVTTVNNDRIWFTAPGVKQIVEFKPSTGEFFDDPVGTFGSIWPPGDIVLGAQGLPWATAPDNDLVGLFLPGTQTLWRWRALPTSGGRPTGIDFTVVDGLNHIWFVQTDAGQAGKLVTTADSSTDLYIWETPLPSANSQPRGIAVDANGHAWITESGTNMIAEWSPPYFHFLYLPILIKQ